MVRARRRFQFALIAPAVIVSACLDAPIESSAGGGGSNGNGNGNGNGENCTLEDQSLQPEQFDEVLPGLVEACSGCHSPQSPGGGFAVFGGAYNSSDPDEHCDFVASIESFAEFADRDNPGDSAMLQAIDGRKEGHPSWDEDQEPRPSIEAYLEAIAGGGDAPGLDEYESEIQPLFDNVGDRGCSEGGACHAGGAAGFTLHSEPAPGSADMRANYDAVVARSDPADPEGSRIVEKATVSHAGSPEFSAAERDALVDWIASLNE